MDSSGSKARIRLSGRGSSFLAQLLKPGMFGLGVMPKEGFLSYLTQFIFLIIALVPGNVVHDRHEYVRKKPNHGGME